MFCLYIICCVGGQGGGGEVVCVTVLGSFLTLFCSIYMLSACVLHVEFHIYTIGGGRLLQQGRHATKLFDLLASDIIVHGSKLHLRHVFGRENVLGRTRTPNLGPTCRCVDSVVLNPLGGILTSKLKVHVLWWKIQVHVTLLAVE